MHLPKGLPVKYFTIVDLIDACASKGVACIKVGDKYFIEGFVSGDTDEKGISIVALDNPEVCLLHIHTYRAPNKVFDKLFDNDRQKILDTGAYHVVGPVSIDPAICPY